MYEKLKSFLLDDAFFTAVLLVLISVLSFGLGRQSVVGEKGGPAPSAPAGVTITQSPKNIENKASIGNTSTEKSVKVVASKSGTKYHLLTCSGANQIKEANKVYFDNVELAKAAGYTPAANCPGLQ
ncbi:hypothetical protein KC730_01785 [Candidatus Kaiserbacteria bacterium]|nr:hypothetical protein [Candidatus Kaiserbacteria bacterium]